MWAAVSSSSHTVGMLGHLLSPFCVDGILVGNVLQVVQCSQLCACGQETQNWSSPYYTMMDCKICPTCGTSGSISSITDTLQIIFPFHASPLDNSFSN